MIYKYSGRTRIFFGGFRQFSVIGFISVLLVTPESELLTGDMSEDNHSSGGKV